MYVIIKIKLFLLFSEFGSFRREAPWQNIGSVDQWVLFHKVKTKKIKATPKVEDCLLSGAKFLDPKGSSFALCSYDSHQIQVLWANMFISKLQVKGVYWTDPTRIQSLEPKKTSFSFRYKLYKGRVPRKKCFLSGIVRKVRSGMAAARIFGLFSFCFELWTVVWVVWRPHERSPFHNIYFNPRNAPWAAGGINRGVYSSVYSYIHIYKKLPFLADFIKNWVHFIKNSDFLLKNDQI